jgi:hypothetical protein
MYLRFVCEVEQSMISPFGYFGASALAEEVFELYHKHEPISAVLDGSGGTTFRGQEFV